jgi:hypothetical protein
MTQIPNTTAPVKPKSKFKKFAGNAAHDVEEGS